eukprot:SAG11_NODE_6238_length_1355_cov_2.575637_1_plen_275_part_01
MATGDVLAIDILPNIDLQLEAQWPPNNRAVAGTFEITGPVQQLATLHRLVAELTADSESETGCDKFHKEKMMHGDLSPVSNVTVPKEHRAEAGIPVDAQFYCFIHPMERLRPYLQASSLKLSQNRWASVLLMGGYAYFGSNKRLLSINAITFAAPSSTCIMLVGHELSDAEEAVQEMAEHGRLVSITEASLLSVGFKSFGWVHGANPALGWENGETFGGRPLSTELPYADGAFVFVRNWGLGSQARRIYIYALVTSANPFYQSEFLNMMERVRQH